ncbi:MAG: rhodanese [Flavobacteriales bacterium]|nr:rhodanese [Flavobacteriales bacterium]|tara:strand:+ start:350 stop:646 length:297 start_codon:yes stop_codon:yes gene_type:complete
MKNLNAIEFKEQIENDPKAVIIDVRAPEEEAEGLIPNSLNINLMDPSFAQKVSQLDPEKHYYVYCRAGGRSSSACGFMESNGYTTFNLAGGIQAWNQL